MRASPAGKGSAHYFRRSTTNVPMKGGWNHDDRDWTLTLASDPWTHLSLAWSAEALWRLGWPRSGRNDAVYENAWITSGQVVGHHRRLGRVSWWAAPGAGVVDAT